MNKFDKLLYLGEALGAFNAPWEYETEIDLSGILYSVRARFEYDVRHLETRGSIVDSEYRSTEVWATVPVRVAAIVAEYEGMDEQYHKETRLEVLEQLEDIVLEIAQADPDMVHNKFYK